MARQMKHAGGPVSAAMHPPTKQFQPLPNGDMASTATQIGTALIRARPGVREHGALGRGRRVSAPRQPARSARRCNSASALV